MVIPAPPSSSLTLPIFSRESTSIQRLFALVEAGLMLLTVLPTAGSVVGSSVHPHETSTEGSVLPPTHGLVAEPITTGTVVGLLWARELGTPAYDEARSVATDPAPTGPAMPALGWKLSDAEVAAVVTYIRNSWGNTASAVPASDVESVRQQLSRRTD